MESGQGQTKRNKYEVLRAQLENERSSFLQHWRDLGDNISPRRMRFQTSDTNRGDRRNQKIVDSTATLSLRTLRSGMMGGVTSPARPWFRLSTADQGVAEIGAVKIWLDTVSQRMEHVFLKSNLYNVLPIVYGDMGLFGTSALCIEEDDDDVVRFYPFPIGTYMLATNHKGQVNTFIRDFRMTVKQIVEKFGMKTPDNRLDMKNPKFWDNFSEGIKNLWENNNREAWIDVCHVVTPNDAFDRKKLDSKFKKYTSVYYERGGGNRISGYSVPDDDRLLREKGYDYFPILCPRWEVAAEDAYGTSCPGMDALGDVKQLQLGEKRTMQAIEKMINPPMVGPSSLAAVKTSILPGDITFSDERDGQKGFRPAHEVNARINELEQKQEQVRNRIKRAFFEDLFLMLTSSDLRDITAREVEERHEEKLLALGPVLEQLNQDLLDPLIDITFEIMLEKGLIPDPPEELHGSALNVEYISIMAQAQKLAGISGIERFSNYIGQLAGINPEAIDKFNMDSAIDTYGDQLSVSPKIIRPDDEVAQIRKGRAQQQQQQQQAQQMQAGAQTAKDLSQSNLDGNNALSQLMQISNAGKIAPQ